MTTEEKVEIVKQLIRENGNKFITVDFRKKEGLKSSPYDGEPLESPRSFCERHSG